MKNTFIKLSYVSFGIAILLLIASYIVEDNGGNPQAVSITAIPFYIIAAIGMVIKLKSEYSKRVKDEIEQEYERHSYNKAKNKARRIIESVNYEWVTLNEHNKIWIANKKLYDVDFEKLIYFCEHNPEMNNDEIIDNSECFTIIPIDQVAYFFKEGDAQYTTKVSGGGGGGSSLTGALVGGLIAGGTGAIIGSRKKNEEIKSTVVTAHNDRKVVIRYNENGSVKILSREDKEFEIYDYLLKKIPEKDLLTIQMNQTLTSNNAVSAEENVSDDTGFKNQDISERLQKLQNLYDSKLITGSEYASKRQDILDSL